MKKETVLSWSILIVLFLTCGGLAIKTFQLNQELTKAKQEIVTIKELEKPKGKAKETKESKELTLIQNQTKMIKEFFESQYNYDTKNYTSRVDKASKYLEENALSQYSSDVPMENPAISITSKVSDLKIGRFSPNNYLVAITTQYTIEQDTGVPIVQIVTVQMNEETMKIEWFDTLGSLQN